MKIALLGATGNVGSALLREALTRGHHVTGLARHPEKLAARDGLTAQAGDLNDPASLGPKLAGHDAVISAVKFELFTPAQLFEAMRASHVARLLVVGGAGSLEVAPGRVLVDTPEFPAAYKAEALAGRALLDALRHETDLDWTFLSPSALLLPGKRTGRFRLGRDELLVGTDGQSQISIPDFAVAMIDELEAHRHSRQRFTVGY